MPALTAEDRERLHQILEQEWTAAGLARDWDASMALCADDFVYLPQDHPATHGKSEAQVFLDGFPHITRFEQSVDHITGTTDLVAARGRFTLTMQAEPQAVTGTGKFLLTASKQSGRWLVTAACFNWDAPPVP